MEARRGGNTWLPALPDKTRRGTVHSEQESTLSQLTTCEASGGAAAWWRQPRRWRVAAPHPPAPRATLPTPLVARFGCRLRRHAVGHSGRQSFVPLPSPPPPCVAAAPLRAGSNAKGGAAWARVPRVARLWPRRPLPLAAWERRHRPWGERAVRGRQDRPPGHPRRRLLRQSGSLGVGTVRLYTSGVHAPRGLHATDPRAHRRQRASHECMHRVPTPTLVPAAPLPLSRRCRQRRLLQWLADGSPACAMHPHLLRRRRTPAALGRAASCRACCSGVGIRVGLRAAARRSLRCGRRTQAWLAARWRACPRAGVAAAVAAVPIRQ